MTRFLLVCFGGAAGTGVRYLIGVLALRLFGTAYPVGTLTVNVVGCFLMGLLMQAALSPLLLSDTSRLVLATGFLGGLTTYSAFNFEVTSLGSTRHPALAFGYLGVTLLACLLAGVAGAALARKVWA